jgi:hypothetical protein
MGVITGIERRRRAAVRFGGPIVMAHCFEPNVGVKSIKVIN